MAALQVPSTASASLGLRQNCQLCDGWITLLFTAVSPGPSEVPSTYLRVSESDFNWKCRRLVALLKMHVGVPTSHIEVLLFET